MASTPPSPSRSPWITAARYMAGAGMLAGCLTLLGWALDESWLKTMGLTVVPMDPVTASALVISGAALLASMPVGMEPSRTSRRLAIAGGAVATLVGVIAFSGYRFGWDTGIEAFLVEKLPLFRGDAAPIPFASTLCLIAVGAAIVLFDFTTKKGRRPAEFLSVIAIVIGFTSLIGYVYGIGRFTGFISYSPVAVHSAAAFVALGCGILFSRPHQGLMEPLTSGATGGAVARQLIPLMLAIPLALGAVKLAGERADVYPSSFGTMAFVVAIILIFVTILWFSANALNRSDERRTEAELASRMANERLRKGIDELEARNRETAFVNEMGDLLQSCQKAEEVHAVVGRFAAHIFPHDTGCLYMRNQAETLMGSVSRWGEADGLVPSFSPEDCWALRRGRVHVGNSDDVDLACVHISSVHGPTFCIPVAGQGQTFGLLHIELAPPTDAMDEETASARIEAKRQLAVGIAERAALAISNLHLRDDLREQSIRDPLTNMFNRRYAGEMMERDLKRAERSKKPLSVIMVDIDYFKNFNDAFGHEAGDSVLTTVAAALRIGVRSEDIVCRYGGEEFLLVLPDASVEDGARRSEDLRKQVGSLELLHEGRRLDGLTLSFGVACYPDHGSTWQEVVAAADRALYEAKRAGRDRVIVAPLPEAGLLAHAAELDPAAGRRKMEEDGGPDRDFPDSRNVG